MRRRNEPPREGYRESASPASLPLTVISVRPGEYAEPELVRRVRVHMRRLARWVKRSA